MSHDRPYLDMFPEGSVLAKTTGAQRAEPPPIPMRDADAGLILRCVAESYMVTIPDLQSTDRLKAIGEARQVAYWLLRTKTKLSFPEIGRVLRKDHTSVMTGVKRCIQKRERDAWFRDFSDKLAAAVAARLEEAAA